MNFHGVKMDEAGNHQWAPGPSDAPPATVSQHQQNFAPQFQHQLGPQEPTQGFRNTAPINGLMAAQQNQPFVRPQRQMNYASSSNGFQPGNQQLVPQNYHQPAIGFDHMAPQLDSILASAEAEKMKHQEETSNTEAFMRFANNARSDLMSERQRLELEMQNAKDENRKLKDELQNRRLETQNAQDEIQTLRGEQQNLGLQSQNVKNENQNLRAQNHQLQRGVQHLLETSVPKDVFNDMVNQVAQKNMQLDDLTKKLDGLNKDRT